MFSTQAKLYHQSTLTRWWQVLRHSEGHQRCNGSSNGLWPQMEQERLDDEWWYEPLTCEMYENKWIDMSCLLNAEVIRGCSPWMKKPTISGYPVIPWDTLFYFVLDMLRTDRARRSSCRFPTKAYGQSGYKTNPVPKWEPRRDINVNIERAKHIQAIPDHPRPIVLV